MSIEQTNQLILLILNSALMTLLSAALLGGAWLRQNMLAQQLQQVKARYHQLTRTVEAAPHQITSLDPKDLNSVNHMLGKQMLKADLKKNRNLRLRLQNQYLWSHLGMLMLHGVLMTFGVSLFALALRSLLSLNSLIPTALILFTLGSAGLLVGTGCILIDLVQGNSQGDSLGKTIGTVFLTIVRKWNPHSVKTIRHAIGLGEQSS